MPSTHPIHHQRGDNSNREGRLNNRENRRSGAELFNEDEDEAKAFCRDRDGGSVDQVFDENDNERRGGVVEETGIITLGL